ncbi:hypothetical protein [uncultured Draconibacterium sp.]|uniref:hypothetical protein n=1 Tax=uncultured Draconibacterium sp. TaxID=1573823 RepID=UPI0025F44942|nr:hypothetical protein [uncultured Draconibacterium sp.]
MYLITDLPHKKEYQIEKKIISRIAGMKMVLIYTLMLLFAAKGYTAVYQWSLPIESFISEETNEPPEAFLWIPENCEQVKAVVFSQQNMCEETIFNHPKFRKAMSELGFAIVWITPGINQQWDVKTGCQKAFDDVMTELAVVSGYTELKHVPLVPIGHSAMATFPWNFAAWNPDKTLAIVSFKGDAPRTNLCGYGRENLEWGRTRNIDGIPGLMVMGEYEWWEARLNPALAFRMMYPQSCISFLYDAGHGHFDASNEVVDYLCLFLQKAAKYRLPKNQSLNEPAYLVKLNPEDGWLAERWQVNKKKRQKPARFNKYKGNKHDAFWYFDEETAKATEAHYKGKRNRKMQYVGYEYNGEWLPFNGKHHAQYLVKGVSTDDLSFRLKAVFVDSTRMEKSGVQLDDAPSITKICGPVEKLTDSTFAIRFERTGMNNTKRSGDIWLLAQHPGNEKYKSAVQQFNLQVPLCLTEGKTQRIKLHQIDDQEAGIHSLKLEAESSSGLPVYFYVKEGHAQVQNRDLLFTPIPPRSQYPVKITVVAWQLGSNVAPLFQTAKPVEQSLYIRQNIEN